MGLSSSQARLLNLTARMHQIEYKAARLEAMKLQMANESTRVYEDYLDAMDKTKIQVKNLNPDGSVTYKDLTSYSQFTDAGYALDYKGVVYNGATGYKAGDTYYQAAFVKITAENKDQFGFATVPATDTYAAKKMNGEVVTSASNVTTSAKTLNFLQLCKDAFNYSESTEPTGSELETIITNLINSGDVTIVTKDKNGNFKQESADDFDLFETSVSTNTGLQEVTDEVNLRKAEAKYEADMKRIDLKDRKYDTDLAALDTERNAIKQEMETLKTVAKDNVERTFKLFS